MNPLAAGNGARPGWWGATASDLAAAWDALADREATSPAAAWALHDLRRGLLEDRPDLLAEIRRIHPDCRAARCLGPVADDDRWAWRQTLDPYWWQVAQPVGIVMAWDDEASREASDPASALALHDLRRGLLGHHRELLDDLLHEYPESLVAACVGSNRDRDRIVYSDDTSPGRWRDATAADVAELWDAAAPYESTDPAAAVALHDLRRGLLERHPELLGDLLADHPHSLAARCVGPVATDDGPALRPTADLGWWRSASPAAVAEAWEAAAPHEAADPAAARTLHDLRTGLLGQHRELLETLIEEIPGSLAARCLAPIPASRSVLAQPDPTRPFPDADSARGTASSWVTPPGRIADLVRTDFPEAPASGRCPPRPGSTRPTLPQLVAQHARPGRRGEWGWLRSVGSAGSGGGAALRGDGPEHAGSGRRSSPATEGRGWK